MKPSLQIQMTNVMRLYETKSIVTVNGQFPGPKIVAREGNRVIVRVINHVPYNITLHWYIMLFFHKF
jgi:laccase